MSARRPAKRRGARRLLSPLRRLAAQPLRPFGWWSGLAPSERVLYRSVALLAAGCGLVWLPLAFIVPGIVFGLVFFGFSFRRAG